VQRSHGEKGKCMPSASVFRKVQRTVP